MLCPRPDRNEKSKGILPFTIAFSELFAVPLPGESLIVAIALLVGSGTMNLGLLAVRAAATSQPFIFRPVQACASKKPGITSGAMKKRRAG
ncbi:MAG TPA: hypothetical protein P5340_00860 [Defluviicoccus sp.]|nr:hypothetical protein [Defluviicoccus sp.]